MFALSPLVSHLIPDSRLPPFDAGLGCQVLSWLASQRRRRTENSLNNNSGIIAGLEGGEFPKSSAFLAAFKEPSFANMMFGMLDVSAGLGRGSLGGIFKRKKPNNNKKCLFLLRFEGRERRETSDRRLFSL